MGMTMSSNCPATRKPAELAIGASPISGVAPPAAHRFKPGRSGNPAGRPPRAGATIREWINTFGQKDLTELQLRKIARDAKAPWTKRTAAERILRTLEAPDMADFEPYLHGVGTLGQLRGTGINTEVVKKVKEKRRKY